jgi:hypothetical protein
VPGIRDANTQSLLWGVLAQLALRFPVPTRVLLTNGASLTGDIGLAYVDGDQTFNKEQALCLPKILSRNCFAA